MLGLLLLISCAQSEVIDDVTVPDQRGELEPTTRSPNEPIIEAESPPEESETPEPTPEEREDPEPSPITGMYACERNEDCDEPEQAQCRVEHHAGSEAGTQRRRERPLGSDGAAGDSEARGAAGGGGCEWGIR